MRPPSVANGFFHRLGETFLDAGGKRKIRCRFCGREYAYNLTKLKEHLCNSGSHSCPKIDEQLKFHAVAIYQLERAVRKGKAKPTPLFDAVGEADKVLAMILKNDNPSGIPLGGLNDVEWLADEDPGGMTPVSAGNTGPMAEGTRGEQIAATDGPIVGAEIGESSKGRANTLPKVDVSSPLNPSQENAEKDPIILNLVKIEVRVAALERENADLRARVDALEWPNANINVLDLGNAGFDVPNLEIPDFNPLDWENENFAQP